MPRITTASESIEQQALFTWATEHSNRHYPELSLLYHIHNGGKRGKAEAAMLKMEGVKAGVPDLHLPVARGDYHGLYIEMKSDAGRASAAQREWITRLREQGYRAEVCVGWQEAARCIIQYMGMPEDALVRIAWD